MGNRGRLPAVSLPPAAPLDDLTPPDWLGDEAAAYYARHAAALADRGILTTATADAYALTCDLWGRVRQMEGAPTTRAYLDAVKAFVSMAKNFRLIPTEAPTVTPSDRHANRPEFSFDGD